MKQVNNTTAPQRSAATMPAEAVEANQKQFSHQADEIKSFFMHELEKIQQQQKQTEQQMRTSRQEKERLESEVHDLRQQFAAFHHEKAMQEEQYAAIKEALQESQEKCQQEKKNLHEQALLLDQQLHRVKRQRNLLGAALAITAVFGTAIGINGN